MSENLITEKIVEFLREIGLEVISRQLDEKTFLSGIFIEQGKMFVDEDKLAFPGDLLHEAGHLAVAPARLRGLLSDEVALPGFEMDAIECGAIAWSYAAALHLELDPRVVFHEAGYKGHSESLLFSFSLGVGVGINVLEDAGMTATGENAAKINIPPYPQMIKWLRD